MDMKIKQKVKMHMDALKALADEAGVSVDDLIEGQMGAEEEGGEEEGGMESEMEGEEAPKAGPDRAKIALIVAKMKKAKGE